MFARLLLVFILVPLADLVLLMVISKYVTIFTTIGLIVISGIIGAWLAKRQSGAVGGKIREQLVQNRVPSDLLTDGAMILFAAGLLITPGLLTDAFGFSLLIPSCRGWYKKRALDYLKSHFKIQIVRTDPKQGQSQAPDIVDGEVVNKRDSKQNVG